MSYITTDSTIMEPRFGHAWRAEGGTIHATVKLGTGSTFLAFESAEDARAVAAACIEAAEAIERITDGGQA